MNSRKLGVISGMGTKAGVLFLNKLIDRICVNRDQDFPEIIFHNNSQIPDRTLAIVYGKESPEFELMRSIDLMNKMGVDYLLSTCVTSYYFLNRLKKDMNAELLNPVDLIYRNLKQNFPNITKIGLLATTGSIRSGLFDERFVNSEYELIKLSPIDQERKFMKSVYMKGGLKSTKVSNEAVMLFKDSVNLLKQNGAEIMIGGCTEVQIGLNYIQENIPILDAIDVLVDEVIDKLEIKRMDQEIRGKIILE